MGACTFYTNARGKTLREAFESAARDAQYEHGHGGYTGTIAEKHEVVLIPLPPGADPRAEAFRLIDACDERIDDKWGPAGAFDLGEGKWAFFGWASE